MRARLSGEQPGLHGALSLALRISPLQPTGDGPTFEVRDRQSIKVAEEIVSAPDGGPSASELQSSHDETSPSSKDNAPVTRHAA
jgi:hypothetical protein